MPMSQPVQLAALSETPYVPALQDTQRAAPGPEYEPTRQAEHVVEAIAAAAAEKSPGAQALQLAEALLEPNAPAGQNEQLAAPAAEYAPAVQLPQALDCSAPVVAENEPAEQVVHSAVPLLTEYVPAPHVAHCGAPPAE